jgi:integrase/recombinase XerC
MPRAKSRPQPDTPKTWAEALARFDRHLADLERSQHTHANYREDLTAFAEWYEHTFQEEPQLALLAPQELREWKAHLREERKLEPATVNRKLAALRSLLKWAEANGHAPEIRAPKSIRKVQPPPRWLDLKQQRLLLRAAERHGGWREEPLVKLLLHTGLRVDEAAALTWEDIEIRPRSGQLTVRRGKGRKQRVVPLNAEAREALERLRTAYPRQQHARPGAVLYGQRGPLTARGIESILQKVAHHARLPEVSPHVLRHTFGHNLASKGVPIQVIADLMGHESLETTRRYVQPGADDLAAAVDQLAGGRDD